MARPERDEEREERIQNEVVVDAYNEYERATGWYCYLQDQLQFPFKATCTARRPTSPLRVNEEVEVIGLAGEEVCEHEMFVTVRRKEDELAVPLAQLRLGPDADEETKQGVEDWLYWVARGYEF